MRVWPIVVGVFVLLSAISAPSSVAVSQTSGPMPTFEKPVDTRYPNNSTRKAIHPKVADGLVATDGQVGDVITADTRTQHQTVIIEFASEPSAPDLATVREHGRISDRHGSMIRASVPTAALSSIAMLNNVQYIREPHVLRSSGEIVSEGLQTINATTVHQSGYTGENVTIAVIDYGFDLEDPEIADQVVDSRDFSGEGIGTRSNHGTATAQIVADVAPDAELIVVSVRDGFDLLDATEWVTESTSADVVSMSLGFSGGVRLDGQSAYDQAISNSSQEGLAWFVSAGNLGGGNHWNGTWNDADADNIMEFDENGDETLSVRDPGTISLQWRDWPYSSNDYDLFLLDHTGDETDDLDLNYSQLLNQAIAYSVNNQSGSQHPHEALRAGTGEYDLVIYNYNAAGEADFDIFAGRGANLQYSTASRSIIPPATGPDAAAVGAIDVETEQLEPYSSRGPTIDGRMKPNFVGPDRVSTSVYSSFSGTSAATPHVAGAAGLVLDANYSVDSSELMSILQSTAVDRGWSSPSNTVGSGLIDSGAAVKAVIPNLAVSTNTSNIIAGQTSAIAIQVTDADTQKPVQNVTVTVSGAGVSAADQTTDANGKATVSLSPTRAGTLTVNATKQGSFMAQTNISVSKDVVQLNLTAGDYTIAANATVTFSLSDTSGGAVDGSVAVNDTNHPTGDDGRVNISFNDTGTFTAIGYRADTNTTTYLNDTTEISVVTPATFVITYGVNSTTVDTGDKVTVTAIVENMGGMRDSTTVIFYADGVRFATKSPEVDGGNSTDVSATTHFTEAGTHNVTVNNLNATEILVEQEPIDAVYKPNSSAEQYDENKDGLIQITELGAAAKDYSGDEISLPELGNVAIAYSHS